MFSSVMIAVKPQLNPAPLLHLAAKASEPSSILHLFSVVVVGTNDDERQRSDAAKQELAAHVAELERTGREATATVQVATARASSEVLREARDREIDLLVIGHARRTRVGKALLGSNAQSILLGAECPVLSIRVQ